MNRQRDADILLTIRCYQIRALSFELFRLLKKKKTFRIFFIIQVRHKASKKVYAMKLLSKFEMVSGTTVETSCRCYIASTYVVMEPIKFFLF